MKFSSRRCNRPIIGSTQGPPKGSAVAIKVLLELTLKSDSLEDSYAGIHDTLVDTRKFAGCNGVDVVIDRTDPAKVVLIENWDSFDAHQAYTDWRGTPEGRPAAMIAALAGAPVQRYFSDAPQI